MASSLRPAFGRLGPSEPQAHSGVGRRAKPAGSLAPGHNLVLT